MIWSIIYLICVLIANYTAAWFIPLPIYGMFPVGLLFFGVTFTARDYVHHKGLGYVYMMIAITGLFAGVLSVFGAVPWRIIAASVTAIVLSEAIDTEIYQMLIEKGWLTRVTGSNAISVPIDGLLFNLVAFGGVLPVGMIAELVFGQTIVKYLIGFIVALWRYTPIYSQPHALVSHSTS